MDGTRIANLHGYDIEEDDTLDPDYVERGEVEETEFGQSYMRSEHPMAGA